VIIHQLRADNLFKYRQLHIPAAPRGVIAVSGPNESGKTAIAEIICLALFGRTSLLPPEEVTRAIKWGEFQGSVTVSFTRDGGDSYTLVRHLDKEGNQSAQLHRDGDQTLLARGAEAVTQAVSQLSGVSYEQFLAGLYSAQHHLAASPALHETVKALSGVAALETISAELKREIDAAEDKVTQLTPQLTAAEDHLTQLNWREEALTALRTDHQSLLERQAEARARLGQQRAAQTRLRDASSRLQEQVTQMSQSPTDRTREEWQRHTEELDKTLREINEATQATALAENASPTALVTTRINDWRARLTAFAQVQTLAGAYRERLTQRLSTDTPQTETASPSLAAQREALTTRLAAQTRSGGRAWTGFWLTLVLALASGGLWGLLTFAPDSAPANWLVQNLGTGIFTYLTFMLGIAGGGLLLACLFLLRALFLTSRLKKTRQQLAAVTEEEETARADDQLLHTLGQAPLAVEVTTLRQVHDEQLAQEAMNLSTGPGAVFLSNEAFAAEFATLRAASAECGQQVQTLCERVEQRIGEEEKQLAETEQHLRSVQQDIAAEETRRDQAAALQQQIHAQQEIVSENQQYVATRRLAQHLVERMPARLYGVFTRELQHLVNRLAPLFTDGRYQSLQMDERLRMQIFSTERGAVMNLTDISGGAYTQLMLAVRLALAQAIIAVAGGNPQFVILDEPFSFVDEQRRRKTLEALPHLSEEIAQVWVIAPRFDADLSFALHLQCSPTSDVLIAPDGPRVS
jgi:DNA repair exonuclease SbcCD ATPase subunit